MKATVKTEVVFVTSLLSDLRNGRLRVPKFQRPFVWNHEKVRRLLDSIIKGYPIGSIFVWETSERFDNLDRVGPVDVSVDHPQEPAPVGYLLDGHQRLSTLMGALAASHEELEHNDESRVFRVYFNLKTEEFEHTRSPETHHFPLYRLIDTNDYLDQCQKIKEQELLESQEWIRRAQKLVSIFQECQVGVTRVFHQEMSEAIEAFTRLNTEGVKMTPEQIFFALSYREGDLNVAAEVDQIVEEVLAPANFGDISRTALLRVLLAAMEKDIYSNAVNWRELVKNERDGLRSALDACKRSLTDAVGILTSFGVSSQKALPYALQLVLLSEFFREYPPTTPLIRFEILEQWFWVSSFSGAFMVGSSARFNRAVHAARALAQGKDVRSRLDLDVPALPLPLSFHPRAARVRAFFLFLKSLKPLDPKTMEVVAGVLDEGFRDTRPVFRNDFGGMTNLANRVLLGARSGGDAIDAFKSLLQRTDAERETVLRSHCIPLAAWDALLAGNGARFMSERRAHLQTVEIEFMKAHGVTPPRQGEVSPEAVVDDSDI